MKPAKIATCRNTTAVDSGETPSTPGPFGSNASAPGTGGRLASRPNSMTPASTSTSAGTITRIDGGRGGGSRRRLRAAPMTRIAATVPRVSVQR